MTFINLATSSLGMINPIETFTSVYNLYLEVRTGDAVVKAATYMLEKLTNSNNKCMFLLLKRQGNARECIF